MIQLLASAVVLSCGEAKDIVRRIDSTQFSRSEYKELVSVIKDSTRRNCKLNPQPGLFRREVRRMQRPYVHYPYYAHPGFRAGWRKPRVHKPVWGPPTLIFRF